MSASSRALRGRRLDVTPLAAALVAAVVVAPLVVVGVSASTTGWSGAVDFLVRPRTGELLAHTGALLLLTVPATVVIGTAAAWAVERTSLPAAGAWRLLMLAPLAVPAFVSSYAWISLSPSTTGLLGAVLVTTLAYFPFVFLPVSAVLRVLDAGDEEAARSLGASPTAAVVRTVLPRLRPAISGGALLVALHLLAEFGVLEMMRYQTFTTAILQQYAVGFSDARGSLLALVLVALCFLVLLGELAVRGRARVARLGPGTHRTPEQVPLGRWTAPTLVALGALTALSVVVPVAMVVRWLVAGSGDGAFDASGLLRVTGTTIALAVAGGLVAVLLALPAAWLLDRRRTAVATVLERSTFLASSVPGVVVALAMVTLSVRWARPLYQSVALLVIAMVVLFLPRAMVTLRAGLAASPPELVEASRSLGLSGPATFARVVLPLTLPSFLTGFVLVALAVSSELTATLLLAPTGTQTLALGFWSATSQLDYSAAAPYAAVMIAVSAPLTLLLRRQIVGQR